MILFDFLRCRLFANVELIGDRSVHKDRSGICHTLRVSCVIMSETVGCSHFLQIEKHWTVAVMHVFALSASCIVGTNM